MGRKQRSQYDPLWNNVNPLNPLQSFENNWYAHYENYITSLAYQLFEWENLPESVDPRYLEMSLHSYGFVGFYKDPRLGFIAVQGAVSGTVDHYLLPTKFHAVTPTYQNTFNLYNYKDMKPQTEKEMRKTGIVIWNNDYHFSSIPSLKLFASYLADIQDTTRININAQKTPVLITTNDNTRFSLENLYAKYSSGHPVIFGNDKLDPEAFQVLKTDAPFVADKLTVQRNAVWNEVMTFLGLNNANLEKRERMVTSEAESNNEQIRASSNVFLKSRREACDKINELYDLNPPISVKLRTDIIEEMQKNITPVKKDGEGIE
jgi:hypothetical protein